jgi:hypothetical protein
MTNSDSHLTPEDLIDVAEDVRADASFPHLSVCDRCRRELTDVRAAMSAARGADVPEPSPLFWTQFSRRVGDALAAEPVAQRRWFKWTQPRVFVPVSALALAAIVVAVMLNPVGRTSNRSSMPSSPAAASAAIEEPAGDGADLENDSSLSLVADLTAGIDLSAAIDAGLTPRGSAEHAVTHMSAEELRALQRLLKEELARGGA